MKKLTQTVLVSFLIAVFILFSAGCLNDAQDTNGISRTADVKQRDAKIYCNATIEDDFDDSSLVVILDNLTSGVNKKHQDSFFGDFKKEYVHDLTVITGNFQTIDEELFRQIFEIRLPKEGVGKENVLNAIRILEKIEGIRYAGPNYHYYPAKVPDDWWYPWQWGLKDNIYGIKAEDAWEITTGSHDVKVGIIDTGIANHPDLVIDRTSGGDFAFNPPGSSTSDTHSHGTVMAGVVGAIGNNYNTLASNSGISGVCWKVTLVPLKINNILLDDPTTVTARVVAAINHAYSKGIKILNYSWAGDSDDPALSGAIGMWSNDILFICAAGNGSLETPPNGDPRYWDGMGKENTYTSPVYPSNYRLLNLISVGSIDQLGNRSGFSNYSSTYVDIFAPGGADRINPGSSDILSTYPTGSTLCNQYGCIKPGHIDHGYHYQAGTSMATAMVTGVAALMLSANSALTPTLIKEKILQNVDPAWLQCTSGGRLNAYKALKASVTTVNIKPIPLAVPMTGFAPAKTVETAQYTGTVEWYPNHTTFANGTYYTATITLKARDGYTLHGVAANSFTVAGATSTSNALNSGVVMAIFPLTESTINIATITGVPIPKAGNTPVSAITETTQFTGTVTWSPSMVNNKFGLLTAYTATITLTPKPGYRLTGVSANFFKVHGATTTNSANSGTVTAVFPSTETTISLTSIRIAPPPFHVKMLDNGIETSQYTGMVTWSPRHAVFDPQTVYTATITLLPKPGYTLYGVLANFFTVAGAETTSNAANSGTVTAVFTQEAEVIGRISIGFNGLGTIGELILCTGGAWVILGREDVYSFPIPHYYFEYNTLECSTVPREITDYINGAVLQIPVTVLVPVDFFYKNIYCEYPVIIGISGYGTEIINGGDVYYREIPIYPYGSRMVSVGNDFLYIP